MPHDCVHSSRVLPYLWLSLAIVWLWLPPQIERQRRDGADFHFDWLASLAIVHGYATGIVSPVGVMAILALALLCYRYSDGRPIARAPRYHDNRHDAVLSRADGTRRSRVLQPAHCQRRGAESQARCPTRCT